MRRLLASIAVAAVVGGAILGAAASLDVPPTMLSAGSAVVSSCDGDGVKVDYRLAWHGHFAVDRVTISEIDDACVGHDLTLVLVVAGTAVEMGTASIPPSSPDDNVVVFPVDGDVPAIDLDVVHIAIT